MLFAIGTQVRLKHTGDRGVITDILDSGMLQVRIEKSDMEIPVFEDDLERAEKMVSGFGKLKKPFPESEKAKPDEYAPVYQSSFDPGERGLYLAFDPIQDSVNQVYRVCLLNATNFEFITSAQLNTRIQKGQLIHRKMKAASVEYLFDILFDQLNDSLVFEFTCWKLTTAGTGRKNHKSLKVKPGQFFKKLKKAPLLDRSVHLYFLFEGFTQQKKPEEDLKTYTQKKVRPIVYKPSKDQVHRHHDVQEYANFTGEIDLHVEKLFSRKGKMNNAEKLRLQLKHFDQFIEKAIRLGAPRVFIIHGIGKGKLRDIIASRLVQMPEVKTFKNEYHPKYGWGATEVIF